MRLTELKKVYGGNGIKHWPSKTGKISISSDYMGEGIPGRGSQMYTKPWAGGGTGYERHARGRLRKNSGKSSKGEVQGQHISEGFSQLPITGRKSMRLQAW